MNPTLDDLKKEIRRDLLCKRNALSYDERSRYDKVIRDRVLDLSRYKDADTVLVYASYNNEVDTYGLMDACLSQGKRVACPKCRIEEGIALLDFFFISSKDDLREGYRGIPEPREEEKNRLTGKEMDDALVIVPMVGYDRDLNRIGYGKGFYDRFLASKYGLTKVGLAYSCQEYDRLPAGRYDIKLDMIITES